jgi:hypothetical protein
LEFWNGTSAKFEGYFIMNSYDTILMEIKKEINEATIEIPKYQLNLTTENNELYHITDCWIDKDSPFTITTIIKTIAPAFV